MANKERGETPIRFGADEYTIKFDLNALVELEEELDGDLNALTRIMDDNAKGRIKLIRRVLHLGLKNRHPDLTVEDVGSLVGEAPGENFGEQLMYITQKFSEAFGRSQLNDAGQKKTRVVRKGA